MKNGRCRMHGGKSTGARTNDGIEKIKQTNLRTGRYTKEIIERRKLDMQFLRDAKEILHAVRGEYF